MNLPNKLTVIRIFMIPIFVILCVVPFDWGSVTWLDSAIPVTSLVATIIFIVAALTDWFDGHLARKYNLITNFGKFADPMADKLLVAAAFIILVEMHIAPSWVVILIISRELAVTGLRLLLVEGGEVLAAGQLGKIKTFTQMIAIPLMLLNNFPFAWTGIRVDLVFLYVCAFFAVWSGIDYFYKNRGVFKGSM
ncbi:TPA: CDP-diacylglycerol--glycerol-3-phosphate 3-phosphatidyltransferase [Listeria monocytogenes]|uniref:CDP-diacylglycerol--glycerol-3-phosphate 3-phosphatidyltransferase n=1 Tax=Listeria monocytogenes TaxID=1639 RepID=UPI0010DD1D42|nr:CDP-diacylglycerol--glycerol-3-phosphate 3-phosphatidyltransferase [Listeria monocytogenes]EAE1293281.1 CDP-diacylglycerol--glycerol-3-phosphate 3-phosphatidyltransferase [Listeria monocytogenes]HAO6017851.1 CDP-diacylglycerol--glycerol-3-phosphate 3-phosphatidyltransferase [Listeria monocytogenes]HAO6020419.1 CDP-diacylglycerol--glycerol-3-phosphate 3-phosphatidyltransferase [Listeria monocytogenes]HAO6736940.1 CDP-diacylglycerol--glycerol-3-phosphate 3-phosphatidyltransferase [Listeria mon